MSLPESQPAGSPDRPSDLSADLEALLFLAPSPVSVAELAEACEADEAEVETALAELEGRPGDSRRGSRRVQS